MRVTGRCHCGQIRFEASIDPGHVTLCHCTDCQTLSGSAYRVSVPAPAETFELEGEPAIYVKTAESGNRRAHGFCPVCATPIYSAAVDDRRSYTLRVGCMDQRAELSPRRQVWCRSALPWSASIEGLERHSRQ